MRGTFCNFTIKSFQRLWSSPTPKTRYDNHAMDLSLSISFSGQRHGNEPSITFVAPPVTVTLASITLFSFLAEALQRNQDGQRHQPQGVFVYVNDSQQSRRRLHVVHRQSTSSRPTVLIESGANSWSAHWRPFTKLLEVYDYPYVTYDRPGYGFSDTLQSNRRRLRQKEGTLDQHDDEEENSFDEFGVKKEKRENLPDIIQALEVLKVQGPFVIVAHSMGALLIERYLAHLHHLVVGLVFVDGATPEGIRVLSPALPKFVPWRWFAALLGRVGLLRQVSPKLLKSYWDEFGLGLRKEVRSVWAKGTWLETYCREWTDTVRYVRNLNNNNESERRNWLGALPISVVLPDVFARTGKQDVAEIQRGIIEYSKTSRVFEAEGCDHFIQLQRPEVVMDAVASVIERAHARGMPLRDELLPKNVKKTRTESSGP